METRQSQKHFTGNPPAFTYPDPENETYYLRFRFEYGHLDDGTLWILNFLSCLREKKDELWIF